MFVDCDKDPNVRSKYDPEEELTRIDQIRRPKIKINENNTQNKAKKEVFSTQKRSILDNSSESFSSHENLNIHRK